MLLRHFVNPLIGQDRVRLAPVNRCIYCGTDKGRLDLEHIIPESIGGALLLPAATCRCGDKLTHHFEGKVANQIFHQIRRQAGIKGKKRKRAPQAMMLPVYDRFYPAETRPPPNMVSPSEHPSMLCLPRIRPPPIVGSGQFFQRIDGRIPECDIWPLTNVRSKGFLLWEMEISPFLQFLAKVAHAAAVATLGFDGFEHRLVPLISGNMEGASDLVGEMPAEARSILPFQHPRGLHEIAVGTRNIGGTEFVLVQMRFFSPLIRGRKLGDINGFYVGHLPPTYVAVAGLIADKNA